ncbi:MdtA/MuxA family multidrug efflux RND transporter periplasmic adaptor subunit [uncultured Nevskia sp.]|uniref:MdtA/MuxA family multidrug efflux RND transporter periplasmic adaptor subunit n=1 Tax=uncultured Nevskia sp. TaxID=228950 RepID=UPI0025E5B25C|nr:MdtA/MuxA family multidrug efflux RND transporter periplasmic adaptor subunit [uncultured Nevskia sp.]
MRRVIAVALVLGAIALLAGYFVLRKPATSGANHEAAAGGAAEPGAGKGGRPGGNGPIPVLLADVSRRDVPIYLDGLGTVQAFNTVTVRPQVSGQLVSVAFEEGQTVKAGELLAQIDPRNFEAQLQQAQAQQAQNQALLNTAKRDLQRFSELVGDGYVSKQQLDTQAQTVAQTEATVRANEAAVQSARISLGYARITAPISGITGLRLVDVGNIVDAGTTTGIVVVTQVMPISVVFTLPEQSLADIRAAGGAGKSGVKVLAFDRDNAKQIATGELTVVDNQIDQTTGTIRMKATFANQDRALWPGQFVNMRLLVRTEKNGLVIPASAVQRGPNGDFVYVEKTDDKGARIADKRDVTVARSENGTALIAKGLNDGDRIVVEGQYRLQPGSKIRLASDPAPPAQPKGK